VKTTPFLIGGGYQRLAILGVRGVDRVEGLVNLTFNLKGTYGKCPGTKWKGLLDFARGKTDQGHSKGPPRLGLIGCGYVFWLAAKTSFLRVSLVANSCLIGFWNLLAWSFKSFNWLVEIEAWRCKHVIFSTLATSNFAIRLGLRMSFPSLTPIQILASSSECLAPHGLYNNNKVSRIGKLSWSQFFYGLLVY
jgi:hypothetical protein